MRFDLVDLRLFVRVATFGNLTKAAQDLPMALAAASARIKSLEKTLNTRLIERNSRGVQLTPAGSAFLSHALAILQEASKLAEDLMEFGEGTRGNIRLFANTNSINEFLPELLSAFLAQNPRINIDMEEHLSQDIVQAIDEGRADLGVIAGNVNTRQLETHPFRQDRLVVIVPFNHPLSEKQEVRFSQVLEWDFVGLGNRSAVQVYLGQMATLLARSIRVRVQLLSFDAVCRMVAAGVGVSVVPETTAQRLQKSTEIRIVGLKEDWAKRDLKIIVRSLGELAPYSRKFFEYLKSPTRFEEEKLSSRETKLAKKK